MVQLKTVPNFWTSNFELECFILFHKTIHRHRYLQVSQLIVKLCWIFILQFSQWKYFSLCFMYNCLSPSSPLSVTLSFSLEKNKKSPKTKKKKTNQILPKSNKHLLFCVTKITDRKIHTPLLIAIVFIHSCYSLHFFFFCQIGRSTEPIIDFIVMDTVPGAKCQEDTVISESTISRFACRILVDRDPPYHARIFAAGFNSTSNIFLGVRHSMLCQRDNILAFKTQGLYRLFVSRYCTLLIQPQGCSQASHNCVI